MLRGIARNVSPGRAHGATLSPTSDTPKPTARVRARAQTGSRRDRTQPMLPPDGPQAKPAGAP
jgi:hypothetical protein